MPDALLYDLDHEQAVLGAILLAGRLAGAVAVETGLTPEHFYRPQHGRIYKAMLALTDRDEPVDHLTVLAELTRQGHPDLEQTVNLLAVGVPTAANAMHYARRVVELGDLRAKRQSLLGLLEAIDRQDLDAIATAEGEWLHAERGADEATYDPDRLAQDALDWLEGPDESIPTPFPQLNRLLAGGLRPGDTTLIASWTSWGKSVLVDGMLEHTARHGGTAHAYINEMSARDRTLRYLARETGIPFGDLLQRRLDDQGRRLVLKSLSRVPFGITVCAGRTADWIARHILRNRWTLAAVDLVQLVPHRDVNELDAVSATLNAAARRAGTHLLVVSQLNQERARDEKRPRPVLRDIRGTGMLANDARNVILLDRDQEELVDQAGGERQIVLCPEGRLILEKAANGRLGIAPVRLEGDRMRFLPLDIRVPA